MGATQDRREAERLSDGRPKPRDDGLSLRFVAINRTLGNAPKLVQEGWPRRARQR